MHKNPLQPFADKRFQLSKDKQNQNQNQNRERAMTHTTTPRRSLLTRSAAPLLALACGLAAGTAPAQPISQSVLLPNQEYTETREDLRVKVLGGHVKIARTWVSGRWWLNPAWASLKTIPDPLGGVLAVDRAGSIYERTASNAADGGAIYAFGATQFIARVLVNGTPGGWRWYDQTGNRIDYGEDGRIQRYSDPAGISVGFQYDSQGHLAAIADHHGRQAITVASDSQGRTTQVSDSQQPARSVRYGWSGSGSQSRLDTVTDLLGHTWRYQYNGGGQITQRTDPLGASVQLTYMSAPAAIPDSPGFAGMGPGSGAGAAPSYGATTKVSPPQTARVASLQNETGQSTNYRIEYDRTRKRYTLHTQAPGNLQRTQVYDAQGLLLGDSVDGMAQLTRSVEKSGSTTQEKDQDARGNTTITQYNAARQPLKTIHPDGSQESNAYDTQGRRTQHTNALGIVSTWKYDTQGKEIEYTEAKGKPEQRTTHSTYDQWGQLTSRTRGAGDGRGQDAITERYEYDDRGNLTRAINGEGHATSFSYNSQGQAITLTNALGHTTRHSYDAAGNRTSSTNALNESVAYSYDARGRRTQSVSAEGRAQRTRYDAGGRVIEVIAPSQSEGQGLRTEYDAAGNAVKTISPGGLVNTAEYDSQGRVTKTTDPAGNAIAYEYGATGTPLAGLLAAVNYPTYKETYQYDQQGRQTAFTQHLSVDQTRTLHQGYDAFGRRVSGTDPAGRTTLYQYDGLGRVTQTTDPMAQHTRQGWNAHDQLISLTDANGNTYWFEYDKAGRQTKETRPMGGAIQYSYDAEGNLTQRTDAGGNTRTYSYDQGGRLTQEEHKLGGTALDQKITYSYDADGQMTAYEQEDGSGNLISSASYTRDAQGRITQSAITYGKIEGGTFSFTIGQGFNADGQLASHTYPDGSAQTYSYSQGQLAKVTLPNQSVITYGNYQWMQPTRIVTPGATKTQSFDALQRYTSIEVKNANNQILASRQYQYDIAGNITQINSDLGATSYGYDNLDRLTKAQPDLNLQNLGLPNELYSYDAVGNRTFSSHQPGRWSYNQDNQIVQYPKATPFSATPPIETLVSYSAQGHMQKETNGQGERTYRYNAAERLIEVNLGNKTVQYRYDPMGRRIAKTSQQEATSQTTYYLYNDAGLVAEANGQGLMTRAYGWNPKMAQQGVWSTDPMWQAQADNNILSEITTEYHYLHTDHLYTPTLATNKQGNADWRGISEAFGATVTTANAIEVNLRFPGQYYDHESGWNYNLHRDYLAVLGRYVERDPLGLVAGVSGYIYPSNPLVAFDSTGLLRMSWSSRYKRDLDNWACNVYPGDTCNVNAGTLAVAVMDSINIAPNCVKSDDCIDGKSKSWRLDEYSINMQFGVHMRRSYEGLPCDGAWVIRAEFDHIRDYDDWARNAARVIAQSVENAQKSARYSSRSECILSSKSVMNSALRDSFYTVVRETIVKHDAGQSDRHLCAENNPRMRP